jgi:hypothetical protein
VTFLGAPHWLREVRAALGADRVGLVIGSSRTSAWSQRTVRARIRRGISGCLDTQTGRMTFVEDPTGTADLPPVKSPVPIPCGCSSHSIQDLGRSGSGC